MTAAEKKKAKKKAREKAKKAGGDADDAAAPAAAKKGGKKVSHCCLSLQISLRCEHSGCFLAVLYWSAAWDLDLQIGPKTYGYCTFVTYGRQQQYLRPLGEREQREHTAHWFCMRSMKHVASTHAILHEVEGAVQVSAAVRKMQEEVEARQRAEAEAARLAEEQRIRVCNFFLHLHCRACVLLAFASNLHAPGPDSMAACTPCRVQCSVQVALLQHFLLGNSMCCIAHNQEYSMTQGTYQLPDNRDSIRL